MNTCIQNYNPVKKATDNPLLTIRLNEPENVRFWRLMELAKGRNPYAGKSDVLRELLGLNQPGVLTSDEIHFFRTGEKKGSLKDVQEQLRTGGIALAPTGQGMPAKISEPQPKKRLKR
jgi:hypothetical protein